MAPAASVVVTRRTVMAFLPTFTTLSSSTQHRAARSQSGRLYRGVLLPKGDLFVAALDAFGRVHRFNRQKKPPPDGSPRAPRPPSAIQAHDSSRIALR